MLDYNTTDVIENARRNASGEAHQSRTRTRAYHGHVTKRFECSVTDAQRHLDSCDDASSRKTRRVLAASDDPCSAHGTSELNAMQALREFADFPLQVVYM